MRARYYIDTSLWIDYLEDRNDIFRPLGLWATEFFKKAVYDEAIIYYSDLVMQELRTHCTDAQVGMMLSAVGDSRSASKGRM